MTAALLLVIAGVVLLAPPVPRPVARRVAAGLAAGAGAAVVAFVVCPVPAVVMAAAAGGGVLPEWWWRRRGAAAVAAARAEWPDAIDTIRGAVRSGATVPEAVAQPGRSGVLKPRFAEYRRRLASGEPFAGAVAALVVPRDDEARRLVALLRMGATLGSADTGRVLAALATFLRADLAQQQEIAARQQWNVAAARLAVVAPWLTVAALSAQPAARAAYSSAGGTVLLVAVGLLSATAYLVMSRVARRKSAQ